MRKLFLASNYEGLQELPLFLKSASINPTQIKLGFVGTAADDYPDKSFLLKDKGHLESFGFHEIIDIDLKVPEDLAKLDECGAVFVEGGNTFYLLKWIRQSGFDKKLKEFLGEDKLYIGVSAGSIVVGTSIETAGVGPSADANDVKLEDPRGLRQVPFMVAVHLAPGEKIYYDQFARSRPLRPIIAIEDGMAIVCEGDRYRLVGPGKVQTWSSKLFR